MPPLPLRRKITVLALATALALPWASAAAPLTWQQTAAGPGLLEQLWSALTSFWEIGATPDDGCKMDPSGGSCAASRTGAEPFITPDDGCKMDPSGGCLPGS